MARKGYRRMCGILGIVADRPAPELPALVRRATNGMRHRGPDDDGLLVLGDTSASCPGITVVPSELQETYDGRTVILAHRRLSIIDLSADARQPMRLGNSGLYISFNGEIYNYRELRTELLAGGAQFTTCSDTEVLLAAYREWGVGCLRRFKGMFAFCILDVRHKKLFLARDPFGIKPLFYTCQSGSFAFASEVPALLQLSGGGRKANPERVFDLLNDGIADYGDETFFAGIRQLPPAHYLEVTLRGSDPQPDPVRYWDLHLEQQNNISFSQAASRLRDLFLESVSLHLRSDVPLGIALSGGIDSSAVIMAARHVAGSGADLHSFSYIADDPAISEETWVDDANRAARATPHKVRFSGEDLAADFESFVALQGEPFAAPVTYAQWRVFQECRRAGIRVLLEGQGADELLAGYPLYQPHQLASLIQRGRLWAAIRLVRSGGGSRRLQVRRLRAALANTHPGTEHRGDRRSSGVFPWISSPWLSKNALPALGLQPRHSRFFLRDALYLTLFKTKLPAFLRWGDRSAMACSVENRVPFLTPQLAEFLFSLPEDYLLASDGTTKAVFREAMRGLVPESILSRRDKVGFTTPYRRWILKMRPLADDLLRDIDLIPCLDRDRVRKDCAGFLAGETPPMDVVHHLWGLLSMLAWIRKFGVEFD
jgi:asparagine synthase (glutamine-hydrolysing)